MKSLTKELWFNTKKRIEFINITRTIQELVDESGVKEGLCLVNAMHITASVFINDDESGLHQDYTEWLERLAPYDQTGYHHNVGEDNGDAHLKRHAGPIDNTTERIASEVVGTQGMCQGGSRESDREVNRVGVVRG